MPTTFNVIYAVLVAVGWPVYDYFIDWPRFMRMLRDDPRRGRLRGYRAGILLQWTLVAVGLSGWILGIGEWPGMGIGTPNGWRLGVSLALLALFTGVQSRSIAKASRRERTRAHVRAQLADSGRLLPRTTSDLVVFIALSVTAGICEEFLFRGYLPWALEPWFGWWGAAALSTVSFGFCHAYQGRRGIIGSLIVGALMTLFVAITHSLLPAMALHAAIDVTSGLLGWIAFREDAPLATLA
jgi:uncharacterized protein